MKFFSSKSSDLRRLFDSGIDVSHISEGLSFCEPHDAASDVRTRMEALDFDVIGVREKDRVSGYILVKELASGICSDHMREISHHDLISSTTPLVGVLRMLKDRPWVFLLEDHAITSIVTRSDLQKTPVRLLIFGLISLLEMNLHKLVREMYPDGKWTEVISPARLEKAKELYTARKIRNEAISLTDCLQLCDKRMLIARDLSLVKRLGYDRSQPLKKDLLAIEKLRDKVAHSQDLITGSTWEEVIDLIWKAEALSAKCEEN